MHTLRESFVKTGHSIGPRLENAAKVKHCCGTPERINKSSASFFYLLFHHVGKVYHI